MTHCSWSFGKRQFIMVCTQKGQKCKADASAPQTEPNKPKHQLPPEPITGARPVTVVLSDDRWWSDDR
jgi:hypothetical protein